MSADQALQVIINTAGLEKSPVIACVVDPANQIVFCNSAWDRFARSNGGSEAVADRVIGRDLLSVCADSVRPFYRQFFEVARKTRVPVSHGYHCSSPEYLRVFRMTVALHGDFLVLRHALLEQGPHTAAPAEPAPRYIQSDIVTLCANCRRARNWEAASWDWVPLFLRSQDRYRFSHGMCPDCQNFYYPAAARAAAQLQSK